MRISIIGPGNVRYHYQELLKLGTERFSRELEGIAAALAKADAEIVILPDEGAPFELALKYKKLGGRRVWCSVPKDDTDLGIKHLRPFMNYKVDGEKLFGGTINTRDWYRETFYLGMLGDVILMLGFSLGSMGELTLSYYMHKVFIGDKSIEGVQKRRILPQIRAGKEMPFSVIVYRPFVKGRLSEEIESYISKHRGRVYYAENPKDLLRILKGMGKSPRYK